MSSPENIIKLQKQVRENASDLQDYLRGLNSWEEEIKKKDQTFDKMKPKNKDPYIPPIRNSKPQKAKAEEVKTEKPKRLKSYDYKSWDKLNVDEMLEEIEVKAEKDDEIKKREREEEYQKDMLKVAVAEKEKGNEHFKGGRYEKAVECYTKGMKCDETNPILPANRAMAYLKLEKYIETEADCTLSLSLDSTYVKAYLRRGVARTHLGKVESATRDFNDVLKLEPENQQVKKELEKIKQRNKTQNIDDDDVPKTNKNVNKNEDPSIVKPIYKPVNQRSIKPLLRIPVQEIGNKEKQEKPKPSSHNFFQNKQPIIESSQLRNELKLPSHHEKPATKPIIEEVKSETNEKLELVTKSQIIPKKVIEKPSEIIAPFTPSVTEVPAPPKTCFQFQSDVKKMKENPELLFKYLKQLYPNQVPSLIKDQLDTNALMSIMNSFKENIDQHSQFVEDFLQHLSIVKRFQMAVMFLSSADKTVIKDVFQKLASTSANGYQNILSLSKKYGISEL